MKRLIIYDIPNETLTAKNDDIMFSANPIVKPCGGCFGCWLKTPGKCVINDRCTDIPEKLSECNELVIVTPITYGGYSAAVKAVIDRSIPYILPYFRIVNGEMHHKLRYKNTLKIKAYFYGDCDCEEQETARMLVKANAVNFGAADTEVYFYTTADEAKEAML